VPAVCVVTAAFADLARTAAAAQGRPDLRLVVLPHPLEPLAEAAVRDIVRARLDDLVGLLAEGR
jgi:hypothetical protein